MSDRGYTESEDRLLAQYELLRDIKEGKRKPIGPVRIQQQPQRAAEPVSTAAATVVQKQPSRLRFKAVTKSATSTEQPGSPPAPRSPPGQSPAPAAGVAGFAAAAPTTAVAAAPSTAEQPVRSTISREQLAALLRKKQEQKQAPAEISAQAPLQADETATAAAVATQKPAAAAHQQQPKSQPKVLKLPSAAPTPVMAQQELPSVSRPAAATDEIDYDAVSSPEYEVDYDAVSSPEYEVSERQKAAAAVPSSNSKQDAHIRTCTPERVDSRKSPAAVVLNTDRTPDTRPGSAAARRRSCSRSSRSRSPAQRLHSRSPTQRLRSEIPSQRFRSRSPTQRLRSRSPVQRLRSRSVTPVARWHSRSRSPAQRARSRSRSPMQQADYRSSNPTQHQHSREVSRGLSRRGRGWRRDSSSRSRSPRPRGARRRGSPDYGLGAGPGAGSGKQHSTRSRSNSRSPSLRAGSTGKGHQQPGRKQQNPTLFVGDLPPVGFASDDLRALFGAYGWSIVSARVQGSQCYGFVEFDNRTDAAEALHLIELRHEGFCVNGTFVRASWARGGMPDWKRGKAVLSRRDQAQGLEGLEAYEHPTARLLRLQTAAVARARAAAVVTGVAVQHGGMDAAPIALPMQRLVMVPGLGTRQLIDYGDI